MCRWMERSPSLLLLGHTDSPSSPAGRLGVLSPHTQAPVVPETTVGPDLLEPLQVLTELVVQVVGHHLSEFAILDVLLPVEEPVRDLVLAWVLEDGHQLL